MPSSRSSGQPPAAASDAEQRRQQPAARARGARAEQPLQRAAQRQPAAAWPAARRRPTSPSMREPLPAPAPTASPAPAHHAACTNSTTRSTTPTGTRRTAPRQRAAPARQLGRGPRRRVDAARRRGSQARRRRARGQSCGVAASRLHVNIAGCSTPIRPPRAGPHDIQPTRQEIPGLVGAVLRADERAGQALHRQRRSSTSACGAPTSPAAWRTPHAGGAEASSARDDLAAIERGLAQIRQEIEAGRFEWKLDLEDVHLNIEARLTAAGRRRRQAPAHRPLAQRPGRDRRAPVAARRDRRASRALLRAAAARAARRWPSSTPTRSCPASPTCRWRSR